MWGYRYLPWRHLSLERQLLLQEADSIALWFEGGNYIGYSFWYQWWVCRTGDGCDGFLWSGVSDCWWCLLQPYHECTWRKMSAWYLLSFVQDCAIPTAEASLLHLIAGHNHYRRTLPHVFAPFRLSVQLFCSAGPKRQRHTRFVDVLGLCRPWF